MHIRTYTSIYMCMVTILSLWMRTTPRRERQQIPPRDRLLHPQLSHVVVLLTTLVQQAKTGDAPQAGLVHCETVFFQDRFPTGFTQVLLRLRPIQTCRFDDLAHTPVIVGVYTFYEGMTEKGR